MTEREASLQEALRALNDSPSLRVIERRLEQMDISADAKAILRDIAAVTVRVGTAIVHVGRRILDFAMQLLKTFPGTAFGVIVALIVSGLIASVPMIGAALASLLSPLLLAFGLSAGALQDMGNFGLRQKIAELEQSFAVLQRAAAR